MKNYLKTLLGTSLLLIPTVSLFAQRYVDSPLGSEGFPDYQSDYEYLADYSYKYKHDTDGIKRLFQIDTVSWDEMREYYDRYVNAVPSANVYAGKDSVGGIWNMLMVRSPLADAPVKEARSGRGVWTFPPLKLRGIQGDKSAVAAFDRLVKKYPLKTDGKNKDKSASFAAVAPEWFDGPLILLDDPAYYMGFIVSGTPWFFYYDEGRLVYSTYMEGAPDYYSSRVLGLDGSWADRITKAMYLFSLDASREIPPATSEEPIEFTWLLTIDSKGKQDAQLLAPKTPDEATRWAFKRLRGFVRDLRRGIFHGLYTSDGRILPGRYIQARYDKRGWLFRDLITLPKGKR